MPFPPPPPSQDQVTTAPTMGVPPTVDYYNLGQTSRVAGLPLPPINESTPNLPSSTFHGTGSVTQNIGASSAAPVVTYNIPPPQPPQHANNTMPEMPAPPRNAFQRMNDFVGRQSNVFQTRTRTRPISISQFVRRHRPSSSHPPTPALSIIGLVTSSLVFIALMTFLFVSNFAANIVAIVYAFSVLCACTYVLVRYNQKKRRAHLDEERGGSRLDLFGRGGAGSRLRNSDENGTQPEMEAVQESEIIVIPRMPVHRIVGDGEADPELPPYTRGDSATILDIPVPPPPNR
ncbi:hypothetical protein ABW20_dc0108878 [Dactylellina cionopaga]|nr:hypothetical protein ABW20_dc0108878 [Dactylellina cionopaga]